MSQQSLRNSIFLVLAALSSVYGQTGRQDPGLEAFDTAMQAVMTKWDMPGAALAVMKGDRLVVARGYGLADRVNPQPVQPDSLFRIGSNTKAITSAAVLTLVGRGKLSLNQRIVDLLSPDLLPAGGFADPRWRDIRLRHLLEHSGGWDADTTFDPTILTVDVLDQFGIEIPVRLSNAELQRLIIQYMAAQPLQFDPGTRYAYSNFGYLLLGRIIERASGRSYFDYVRSAVFAPAGITRALPVAVLPTGRHAGEVDYYGYAGEPLEPSPYYADRRLVSGTDGGAYFDPLESVGGWVMSTPDLLRFATALDGRRGRAILAPELITRMLARPSYAPPEGWMGLGWMVFSTASGDLDWLHAGGASGFKSLVFRGTTGDLAMAAQFNSSPPDEQSDEFFSEVYSALKQAAGEIHRWPEDDQWARYDPVPRPRIADAGPVNAASQLGGGVSPWETVLLFGERLTASDRPRVLFDGRPATVLSVSDAGIRALVPTSLAGHDHSAVRVEVAGQVSDELVVPVRPAAPGLFTVAGNGRGPVLALNHNGTRNSEQNAAAPGAEVTLFVTGVGWPPYGVGAGVLRISIGGQPAAVIARWPVVGGAMVVVRVPSSASSGEVEVRLAVGELSGRLGTTLFVR
jgi:N-acyl-D-amino-acid deacylase